ncbi:MAG: DNA mismatch repair endonuclease MutL [Eubacteriaceae bacterium]|nr:DNA mismatch repair endonuclease MutL [Eubacteriaceae bacterium]
MIRVLEKQVADKIAAGEVIERPASIVKELLENAIDAGSDNITVEIKKGGKSYIRITDNGSGIPDDQTETAFKRHATSKISRVSDLDSLMTLGFRGEALASIAAVSRVEMITKTPDQRTGTRLIIEGGTVIEKKAAGCPDGTTLVVRDLFYNTPAREKFMRSDSGESGIITGLTANVALAYPGIRIRMINNDKILFSTKGDGIRLDAIASVAGPLQAKDLIHVDSDREGLHIEGYISDPGESRASKKYQVYFVNGRPVDSKVMEKGVSLAYSDRLFSGRYPVAYLFLTVDPEIVDVNIHPNKREVRFDDDKTITEFIRDSLTASLSAKEAVPKIKTDTAPPERPAAPSERSLEKHSEKQTEIKDILREYKEEKKKTENTAVAEEQAFYTPSFQAEPFDVSTLERKGTVLGTYIIADDGDDMYLIDQHAAHERIYFEQILFEMENTDGASQMMLTPVTVDAMFPDDTWTLPLNSIGYIIEGFGPGTWIIKGIPAFMEPEAADAFMKEYMDNSEDDMYRHSSSIMEAAAAKACKAAVKAHDRLSDEEADRLISDLGKCKNPFSCPHGRPTFIKMTRYDIEKKFKRV